MSICCSDTMEMCLSCRYWTGARNINFSITNFEALSEKGRCCGVASTSFRGSDTNPMCSCRGWEGFRGR